MQKQKSLKELKTECLKSFELSEDFAIRLQELEALSIQGKLTHDSLKELFELYSRASSHYEVQGMMEEFNFYIQRMQNLLKDAKIQHLLARRRSRELAEEISISMEAKKEKIDKIKNMIKENKKGVNSKEMANNLLNDLNKAEKAETMVNKDINAQEESFKKRLEEKRLRGNSLPQTRFKSFKAKLSTRFNLDYISNNQETKDVSEESKQNSTLENTTAEITPSKRGSLKKTKTPPKRKSILTLNTFGDENTNDPSDIVETSSSKKNKFKKPNLEIDLTAEKLPTSSDSNNLIVNEDNINEIFDHDYDQKIESNLIKVWESAEKQMTEDVEKIEAEMEKFLDNIADEKFKKTLEINNKYDNELKSLESDIDLNDENNINTIIYKQILSDRQNEIDTYYKELDERKKKGLQNLRNKAKEVKSSYEKMKEINKIKSDIAQGIKTKIIKSLTPKESLNKKFDFSNVNYTSLQTSKNKQISFNYNPECERKRSANSLISDESEDEEPLDNIQLNTNFKKKEYKPSVKTQTGVKPIPAQKRISTGYIGASIQPVNAEKNS